MDRRILYRGVSLEQHGAGSGLSSRSSETFELMFRIGDLGLKFDMGAVFGSSATNAVIAHQIDSSHYPTRGISTTPHFDRARHYALNGGRREMGMVYHIDASTLSQSHVSVYVVSDYAREPNVPEDDEVILVPMRPVGQLPQQLLLKAEVVSSLMSTP